MGGKILIEGRPMRGVRAGHGLLLDNNDFWVLQSQQDNQRYSESTPMLHYP